SRPGQAVPSAEDILDNALVVEPGNKAAQRLKQKLNTPGYYNTAITPEFRGDVEKVKRLLLEGKHFLEAGRFDLAVKRGDQALEIDPYNSAARKLQEEANVAIKTTAESGTNEARSRAFRDVEKAWSNSVKHYGNSQISSTDRQMVDASKVEKLRSKIDRLILPEIQFTDTPIFQVADILTRATQGVDSTEHNSGVLILANFAANSSNPNPTSTSSKTSILDLSPPASTERSLGGLAVTTPKIPGGFSLREILDMVTSLVDVKWVIKENRVEIVPKGTPTDTLVIRHWMVSPFLFSSKAARVDDVSSTGVGANILGSGNGSNSKQGGKRRIDPKEFLSDMNVRFDVAGSTATFNPRNRELTVYNTVEMLDLVDSIVANSEGQAPVQVDIRAKFVEFTQTNLKELSFDWLLGDSNVPGNKRIFTVGGGTPDPKNFPFVYPGSEQRIGRAPLTGGNRSGVGAIASNAIDGLLSPAVSGFGGTNPAALAIAGALTDPQFQLLVRALDQRKDVDLLSSPSITARDQEEASIDIVREFRYPTEFTPPQIPQTIGNTGATGLGATATVVIPVTPTTPSAFEKRDTGVKLRVTPSIKGDNYAIDLELHPEVTEFEGFINYGSPILAGSIKLTENVINQPIFSTRRLQTTVTLLDGETIALGGLMREDVQKVNDKVPFLGDLPLVGRLFRSNVDQRLKKNLTIFVTARIIDASGQPLKASKAETEIEEVPPLTTTGVLGMAR
ncbi:MAG: type II and III secretion system protein, partial [Verrucomicrobiota bacterium]